MAPLPNLAVYENQGAAAARPPPDSASEGPPGTGAPTGTIKTSDQHVSIGLSASAGRPHFLALDSPNRSRRVKSA